MLFHYESIKNQMYFLGCFTWIDGITTYTVELSTRSCSKKLPNNYIFALGV